MKINDAVVLSKARSDTEELRAQVSTYKGKTYVGIRVWYSDNGTFKPGKNGITLPLDEFSLLRKAVIRLRKYIEAQEAKETQTANRKTQKGKAKV